MTANNPTHTTLDCVAQSLLASMPEGFTDLLFRPVVVVERVLAVGLRLGMEYRDEWATPALAEFDAELRRRAETCDCGTEHTLPADEKRMCAQIVAECAVGHTHG